MDTWSAGATFTGVYGASAAPVAAARTAKLTLTVPPLSAVVLPRRHADRAARRRADDHRSPPRRRARPSPRRPRSPPQVTGDPLATVTFAAQVGRRQVDAARQRRPRPVHGAPRPDRAGRRHEGRVQGRRPRRAGAAPRPPGPPRPSGTPAQSASRDWAVVHYQRPAGGYDDWGLYAWGDIDPAYATEWPTGQPFAGEDSYGRFAWVKLKPGATVGRLPGGRQGRERRTSHRTGRSTYEDRRGLGQAGRPGDLPEPAGRHRRTRPAGRGRHRRHPLPPRRRQLRRLGPAPVGRRRQPDRLGHPAAAGRAIDAFGAVFRVPLAAGATGPELHHPQAATRRTCPTDQRLDFADAGREVWLLAGTPRPPAAVQPRPPPARTPTSRKQKAHWIDRVDRRLADRPDRRPDVRPGRRPGRRGRRRRRRADRDVQHAAVDRAAQRAHRGPAARTSRTCGRTRAFTLDPRDLAKVAGGPARSAPGRPSGTPTGTLLAATGVQIPGVLDDVYARGHRRRARPDLRRRPAPTLAVWAPTAQTVQLQLFDSPTATPGRSPMRRDDRTGVWSVARRPRPGRASPTATRSGVAAGDAARSSPPRSPTRTRWPSPPTPRAARSSTWPTGRSRPAGWSTLRKPGRVPSTKAQISRAARPRLLHRGRHRAGRAAGHLPRLHRPGQPPA